MGVQSGLANGRVKWTGEMGGRSGGRNEWVNWMRTMGAHRGRARWASFLPADATARRRTAATANRKTGDWHSLLGQFWEGLHGAVAGAICLANSGGGFVGWAGGRLAQVASQHDMHSVLSVFFDLCFACSMVIIVDSVFCW